MLRAALAFFAGTRLADAYQQQHGLVGSRAIAEAATAATDIGSFLQYGVLGLVVVGFITGWIAPGYQAKALAAENARLLALFENKLFPLIESSADALGRSAVAMEKSADALNKRTVDEAVEHAARDRAGQ